MTPSAPWSQGGGSGSAIVDSADYVVGLHFARAGTTGQYGLADPELLGDAMRPEPPVQ
jgi:hypothetical protein